MATFSYQAYDTSGAKFEGEIDASDKKQALELLKQQGLLPSAIQPTKSARKSVFGFSEKISLADLEFLTSELSLLLASGVRIDRGIDIIRKNKAKPSMASLLSDISQELKGGSSLSSSLRKYPDVFSSLYCNLVELGENSGNLSQVFADLAKDLRFRRDLQRKIIGSLTYPLVIFFVCVLSVFFVFNFIIPRMSSMFDGMQEIPWYTSMLLSTSRWLNDYQGILFVLITLSIALLIMLLKKPPVKFWLQAKMLSVPFINTSILTVERIRFNSGLALMLGAGLPIDKAMALCIGNLSNHDLRKELEIAKDKVKSGDLLSGALKQTRIYPPFFISLIEVGEESGNLETVFGEIAHRSRQEFESWTEKMTNLLEPLMILFMGGLVGGIVIIMLLSMISVNDFGL